jgi:hypothetical protein
MRGNMVGGKGRVGVAGERVEVSRCRNIQETRWWSSSWEGSSKNKGSGWALSPVAWVGEDLRIPSKLPTFVSGHSEVWSLKLPPSRWPFGDQCLQELGVHVYSTLSACFPCRHYKSVLPREDMTFSWTLPWIGGSSSVSWLDTVPDQAMISGSPIHFSVSIMCIYLGEY